MIDKIKTLRKSLDGMVRGKYVTDLRLLSSQLREIEDSLVAHRINGVFPVKHDCWNSVEENPAQGGWYLVAYFSRNSGVFHEYAIGFYRGKGFWDNNSWVGTAIRYWMPIKPLPNMDFGK